MSDLVGYTTPKINGFSATFNAIKGTEGLGDDSIGDSTSTSFSYDSENFILPWPLILNLRAMTQQD